MILLIFGIRIHFTADDVLSAAENNPLSIRPCFLPLELTFLEIFYSVKNASIQ